MLAHWSNGSWTNMGGPGAVTGDDIVKISGASQSDIWAVTAIAAGNQQLLHYDGTAWTVNTTSTPPLWNDVWAEGVRDAWAVGPQGAIEHWDGATWERSDLATGDNLRWVTGSGPGDRWIAAQTYLLHWTN
jgi:hypothetical protein